MPPIDRQTRLLLRLAMVGAILLPLAGAGAVAIRSQAAWREFRAAAATATAAATAEAGQREPLAGPGRDEAAFPHYRLAMFLASPFAQDETHHLAFLPHTDDTRIAGWADVRAAWEPALAALRAGARARDRRDPEVAAGKCVNLLHARAVVNAAICEARARRRAGEGSEAVAWTLDAASLGADLLAGRPLIDQMIGTALLTVLAQEAWPAEALQQLAPAALQQLADGLARLDALLPGHLSLQGELRGVAHWFTTAPQGPDPGLGYVRGWRYGWSPRWMLADGYLTFAALDARLRTTAPLPMAQREALRELEYEPLRRSGNPVVQTIVPNLGNCDRARCEVLAQVRLLRLAVAARLGQELPELADPLGEGQLVVTQDGADLLLQSAGSSESRPLERRVRR